MFVCVNSENETKSRIATNSGSIICRKGYSLHRAVCSSIRPVRARKGCALCTTDIMGFQTESTSLNMLKYVKFHLIIN